MTSRKTAIPPLLAPYLRLPPEASLLLLTGVLNATPHWLTTRVLRSAYGDNVPIRNTRGNHSASTDSEEGSKRNSNNNYDDDVAVVLVSWMRDWEFWKAEARRGAGLDLARLAQENRFAFVDGLTGLFGPPPQSPQSAPPPATARAVPQRPLQPTSRAIPERLPGPPGRTLPVRGGGGPTPPRGLEQAQPQNKPPAQKNITTLDSPSLSHALEEIATAITTLRHAPSPPSPPSAPSPPPRHRRIILILDSPTLPLTLDPKTTSTALTAFLLSLRERVYSTVVALDADTPFLCAAAHALQRSRFDSDDAAMDGSGSSGGGGGARGGAGAGAGTPLENEVSRFVVQMAHAARWIVGVRGLDTGVARDVSGVVRVTRGGSWDDDDDGEEKLDEREGKEMEVLYFVQGDGGVNVFERGGGQM